GFQDLRRLRVVAADDSPFPMQVDGDYVGEFRELDFGVEPAALSVVS
ncbi:MAG: diacylglycerol kinase family lipid kinase, partial [Actinobacteria bacterium]|nr:diacylglycerol kinase family lipid kinase [Actinomycetota bacterium]